MAEHQARRFTTGERWLLLLLARSCFDDAAHELNGTEDDCAPGYNVGQLGRGGGARVRHGCGRYTSGAKNRPEQHGFLGRSVVHGLLVEGMQHARSSMCITIYRDHQEEIPSTCIFQVNLEGPLLTGATWIADRSRF